ncbi:hypothetical protein P9847_01380 [Paenibacillus chibensis]|uniref:Uncharacterized protein n=1 Tax=Paenibacillus chibensis TaxID=59846 RepID=A0ABU6PPM7_9BACL|nr:hypothetical protein [Paenibacillus chibensis]
MIEIKKDNGREEIRVLIGSVRIGTLSEEEAVDYFADLFEKARSENLSLINALQASVEDKMTEDIIMAAARHFIVYKGLEAEFQTFLNQSLHEKGSEVFGPVQ